MASLSHSSRNARSTLGIDGFFFDASVVVNRLGITDAPCRQQASYQCGVRAGSKALRSDSAQALNLVSETR